MHAMNRDAQRVDRGISLHGGIVVKQQEKEKEKEKKQKMFPKNKKKSEREREKKRKRKSEYRYIKIHNQQTISFFDHPPKEK